MMTNDVEEKPIWLEHLGLAVNSKLIPLLPRVWIGHFSWKDINISKGDDDSIICDGVCFKFPTKFTDYEKGNRSLLAPPRPSATRKEIQDSVFYTKRVLTYEDCVMQSGDIHVKKRRRKIVTETPSTKSTPSPFGRPLSNPYWEFFIGMADSVIFLMRAMNMHGRSCPGQVYFKRSDVTTKRFSLRVKCTCSLEKQCRQWDNGIFRWESCTEIRFSDSTSYPVPDVLYALGVSMTPNTMAHSDQLLSSMLLTPPSRMLLKEIIRVVVDPYLAGKKKDIISAACDQLKVLGTSPILCMDVGHSSARNSQAATLAAASGNILLFTMTDTKTNAWLKESSLVARALEFAIVEAKLDISSVEIDDNAKNALLISSFKRINGPEGIRDEPVKAAIDVFHAAKSMGKNIIKISKDHLTTLEKIMQPLCTRNIDVPLLLSKLTTKIRLKSEMFFTEINGIFTEKKFGSDTWKEISTTPECLKNFSIMNGFMESAPDNIFWAPVISTWNTLYNEKKSITSMSGIKISSTMTLKTLRGLSKTVSETIQVDIPTPDKGAEKETLIQYLRDKLPDICSRGHNFHTDLESLADEFKADLVLPDSDARIQRDEGLVVSIFGTKSPTLKDVKKLSTGKILLLAAHLAGEMSVDVPVGKKLILAFCITNFWRINNLWEDVKEAMLIANKAFLARIGEFKRTFKSLLRVANEQFGMFSMKFRMNFVIRGLLNFVEHFSNNHQDCPRYFWWTQCADTFIKYIPAQDYCTVITSGRRGPGCRDLIPVFFKIFVEAFVMSRYCEIQLWKCISFSKTTVCESYFHWKGIMIPKWQNITPSEYERKETAAFIAFVTRQKEKKFLLKKLVKSKYAATLTVASAHKNSRYERHILDAVLEVCGADPSVVAAINHYTNKYNMRQNRRQCLQDKVISKYEGDQTAQNLNLGPVKHEWRTCDSDGCINGKDFCETEFSARPVPPFPFLNECLLNESQRHRIQDVWESSRALKRSRNDEDYDAVENEESQVCSYCANFISEGKEVCNACGVVIHASCLEYNTEWETTAEGQLRCKNCSSFNRMEF